MKLVNLLKAIICVSEKASELARSIRSEKDLFELLVEEKTGACKNKRFVQDFKTLADVLVQELVKHHLSKQFPGINENIFGEESNTFTSSNGETVVVQIKENEHQMLELLENVLDGNKNAAELLTRVIMSPCVMAEQLDPELFDLEIPTEQVAIWIDPIDSTAQYIQATDSEVDQYGIHPEGLPCVTVLIGAYDKTTGLPILGVVEQPFGVYDQKKDIWSSRLIWGVCYQGNQASNVTTQKVNDKISPHSVILSTSESPDIISRLEKSNTLVYTAGAGYKLLCVSLKLIGSYLVSKNSTFKWDTCSPHAILKSLGGNILYLDKTVAFIKQNYNQSDEFLINGLQKYEVMYDRPDFENYQAGEKWSNQDGIFAYWSPTVALHVLKSLV